MIDPNMAMVSSYDYRLVTLSVVIAMLASYAALDLAGRTTAARGRVRLAWLVGGATAMGVGIWSMHYIGMLAFTLPVLVLYDWPTVLLSLVAAIFAAAVALFVVSRQRMGWLRALTGSAIMGSGIATMHYTGMAAMRLSAMCSYDPLLLTLSVVLAIVISLVALWLTFRLREDRTATGWWKTASAIVMGAAIPVMHYTGMAAARFTPSTLIPDTSHAVSTSSLGIAGVSAVTLLVLGVAVLTSAVDRRFSAQSLELDASEQRYRLLIEGIRDYAIFTLTPDGHVASWNLGAERIKGYRAEEIIGRHFSCFYAEEDIHSGKPEQELRAAISEGRFEDECWRLRKDGSKFWANVVVAPLRDSAGQLRGFSKVTRDITERKRSEQTQARLVAILEAAPDFIGFADAKNTHILYVNRAGRKMTGLGEAEDVTKLKIADVHPEWTNQMMRDRILPAATRDGFWAGECAFLHRDGHEIPVLMALHAHKTLTGEVEVFSTISRNIAERKRMEEALKRRTMELEAVNKELEAFSYSVSHDLRAPLRAIDGFSLALLEDCQDRLGQEEKAHLQRVRAAAARMGQLIDDMLKLARTARCEMVPQRVDLSRLAQEIAFQLQKSEPKRQARFVIAPGLTVEGDRGLLRIVLENLLANAWKFTSRQPDARVELGSRWRDTQEVYFVRDNGVGFDMRYADKLFGAFQRLHDVSEFPGTGVGLATVQRIIHRHGGQVWAEGAVGQGATFYFILEATDNGRGSLGRPA